MFHKNENLMKLPWEELGIYNNTTKQLLCDYFCNISDKDIAIQNKTLIIDNEILTIDDIQNLIIWLNDKNEGTE